MSEFTIEIEETEEASFLKRLGALMSRIGLTPFSSSVAVQYLKAQLCKDGGSDKFDRVMKYLLNLLNGRHSNRPPLQIGCPNIIPELRARPIWRKSCECMLDIFPWISLLEDNFSIIRSEFNALRGSSAFQPYRSPQSSSGSGSGPGSTNGSDSLGQFATDSGTWNVAYLYLHGLDFTENLTQCPNTASIISQIPRNYHHAFFSAMAPNTHITPHYGPTNKKLRIHFPLQVPAEEGAAWLRVAGERVTLKEGQCVMFDDSHEHEAGNDSCTEPRVVLILDVWHPDLSDEEVRFLSFLNKGQMAAAKRLAKEAPMASAEDKQGGDFLSVILRARRGSVQEGAIWGHNVVDD